MLPRLRHVQRLPLRISCIGTARYDGLGDADGFDRSVIIGECPSEDAMIFASQHFARGEALLQMFGLRRDFPFSLQVQTTWTISAVPRALASFPLRSASVRC
ncbi:hypothetical protein [Paracoccus sp. N5]|uniref:hypothetical protein n=1 Tax=Paracoccus sp. N5 TaxID=1101189 RepID=UPI00037BC4BA|nr:hypothetical protein [Paracoccus sp. N5]